MILFYPQDDEMEAADADGKLEILLSSAERYKAFVLDASSAHPVTEKKTPHDIPVAYNWDGLAALLRQIREMPESSPAARLAKAMKLEKLVTIYEVLRSAKMSKLEAVRLALMSECAQLRANK